MNKKPRRSLQKTRRVEINFLEALHHRCPKHAPLLEALGDMYSREGLHEQGLKVDLELIRLKPDDSENWYNLACSYATLGRREEALKSLESAIRLGYDDFDWMAKDKDLASLWEEAKFQDLLRRVKKR